MQYIRVYNYFKMNLKEQITDINFNKYPNANTFRVKINELNQQLPAILDDYKKYYVFFHKNPEVSEYQKMFENMEANMQQTNNNLSNIATSVSETINEINDDLLELNTQIKIEKTKNAKLNKLLGNIQNEKNGANEMTDDYTEIYNMMYLRNIAMLFGIFGCVMIAKQLSS